MFRITFASFFCCIFFAGVCNTYADDLKTYESDEVVVTGTPGERKIGNVTSTVGVITEEEIEASNSDYVMDVIGSMPGVYIRQDAIYGRQDITIRGLGSNVRRLQVLVDGRPEKMSLFGCTVSQTLPLSNVERIEVVRGPESTLYGSDAMGGVINIITKQIRDPGYESSALLSYGGYETMHSLIRHGGNTGTFDYYITYDHKQTDGHRANSAYGADFLSLRTGYAINETWQAKLSGQYFSDDGDNPGPNNDPYVNNDKQEYMRYSWDADLIGKWNRSEVLFTVYDNEGEHQFNMPTIADYWHSKDRTLGLNARYSREVYQQDNMMDTITAGYELQNQWAEPEDDWIKWAKANMPAKFMDFGDYNRINHDIYTFNEFVKGKWINTLGLRGHWDDQTEKWEALPHAGLLYVFSNRTSSRAKISKGYRQPRFSELYLFPAHDEDLEPEEVWSYEAAINHSFTPRISVSVNPFYMDVENMIQTVANNNPPPMSINRNSGQFIIQGVEAGFKAIPVERLHLSVNYTYTGIEDGPDDNPHVNREGEPEHVIDVMAMYSISKFTVSADAEYISGLYDSDLLAGGEIKKVDDFVVFGLKGSCQVQRNLNYFIGVENLFNADYEKIPGYPMPGARLYMGLKAEMNH
ncbi:MAG: TonB-dependent receptor [Candidatus Latescibacteria bacterium]|nr:TonB-dependent receptor [Candidatus Latescibacterota bacterium]